MEELLNRIGDRIRKARLALGLTQEAFAERANLHVSYVGQIERGLREPSLRVRVKVCDALDLQLHLLVAPDDGDDVDLGELALIANVVPGEKRSTFIEAVRKIVQLSRT